jgi:hypothetical protein
VTDRSIPWKKVKVELHQRCSYCKRAIGTVRVEEHRPLNKMHVKLSRIVDTVCESASCQERYCNGAG